MFSTSNLDNELLRTPTEAALISVGEHFLNILASANLYYILLYYNCYTPLSIDMLSHNLLYCFTT